MFGLALLPLTMIVGLAVDYSFYIQAQSQLNLAADAAALHAVRVASQAYGNGLTTVAQAQQAAQLAGQQWFQAQAGPIYTAEIAPANIVVNVVYAASPAGFTATVSYSGTVATHISHFILPSWNIASSSTAAITDSYVEILMLLDNSSSMLIGATMSDIVALEKATPCSTQSANEGQDMANYSWAYAAGYGYGSGLSVPQPSPQSGACAPGYTGDPSACFYVPATITAISPVTGLCTNGGGATVGKVAHTPQAPCAFACHNNAAGKDYYGLARSLSPSVTLRLDVVEQAAANVLQSLQSAQESPNQFSVGVYLFNNTLTQAYPPVGGGEAGTDLAAATNAVNNLATPLTIDAPNTNFGVAAGLLAGQLGPNGDGLSPAAPLKDIFIVTDGMADYNSAQGRNIGPMTNAANEQTCQQFKNLGLNVYVLYTPYLPLPNPFYLGNVDPYLTPPATAAVIQALQACASSPATFFQASDPTAINTAMQQMLQSALNSPGRILR